eukprot:TRINITY_DN21339_c0_g2_i1.p1 TRINITY_DN21339_c0_g2~~TRINITY_DN21339_c0_g2_i1.p1  ORF type:complete len:388 (-),score=30.22 TRINITY_DN21339_c0_g2_i1:316-1386(-)
MAEKAAIAPVRGHTKIFINRGASRAMISDVFAELDRCSTVAPIDSLKASIADLGMQTHETLANLNGVHSSNLRESIHKLRRTLPSGTVKQLELINKVYSFTKHYTSTYNADFLLKLQSDIDNIRRPNMSEAALETFSTQSTEEQDFENDTASTYHSGFGSGVDASPQPDHFYIGDGGVRNACQTVATSDNFSLITGPEKLVDHTLQMCCFTVLSDLASKTDSLINPFREPSFDMVQREDLHNPCIDPVDTQALVDLRARAVDVLGKFQTAAQNYIKSASDCESVGLASEFDYEADCSLHYLGHLLFEVKDVRAFLSFAGPLDHDNWCNLREFCHEFSISSTTSSAQEVMPFGEFVQ